MPRFLTPPASGSSPRMRGKPRPDRQGRWRPRIIPAHAGQTTVTCRVMGRWTDHPRACGANRAPLTVCHATSGSSPRMRGKRYCESCRKYAIRIIPAHAGQTTIPASISALTADHPRACGANHGRSTDPVVAYGSSPRMRGKQGCQHAPPHQRRIIPAHAGQTVGSLEQFQIDSDHPRACGANSQRGAGRWVCGGSSPRMRGKQRHHAARPDPRRIIPAHAGQTTPMTE